MTSATANKKLYNDLWQTKRVKPHTFWSTWKKFRELIPGENAKLLDIGCGMRPRIPVKDSYFVDISDSALDIMKSRGGICTKASATKLPYKSDFFDFVNATEVLEHIEEDEKVFKEVARVLKKGKYFSFSVPLSMKYWSKFDEKVNHVRRYEPEELYKKIEKNGFKVKFFYMNNPSKSAIFKNFAAFLLNMFPQFALFLEENITLPIAETIQKLRKQKWHETDFVSKLKDASGVIVICEKK